MPNGIRLPIAKSMAFVVIFSCSSHASYVYTCVETHRDALQTRIMYVHITIRVFLHKMLYIYIWISCAPFLFIYAQAMCPHRCACDIHSLLGQRGNQETYPIDQLCQGLSCEFWWPCRFTAFVNEGSQLPLERVEGVSPTGNHVHIGVGMSWASIIPSGSTLLNDKWIGQLFATSRKVVTSDSITKRYRDSTTFLVGKPRWAGSRKIGKSVTRSHEQRRERERDRESALWELKEDFPID